MPSCSVSTFRDPYDFQRRLRGADVDITVTSPGDYRGELTRIDLHHLWMQRGSSSLASISHAAYIKTRQCILFLANADQAPTTYNGRNLPTGRIILPKPGAEHYHRKDTAHTWAAMSLTTEDFAEAAVTLRQRELTPGADLTVLRPSPQLMSRLYRLHAAICHLAATMPDVIVHAEVAKCIEQEAVRAMVECVDDGAAPEPVVTPLRRIPIMSRLARFLGENEDRPVYVTEICAAIGVSDRTLRLHCLEHLGMSPHRYLWLRRMNLARRALCLADHATTTVTTIANDLGFGELGRFAVAYKCLFGESPSVSLRRSPEQVPTRHCYGSSQEWQSVWCRQPAELAETTGLPILP